jgi:hypothetical protein
MASTSAIRRVTRAVCRKLPSTRRRLEVFGDAALEARAMAAFDDKLIRLGLELVTLDPGDEVARAELAYFDKR